MKNCFKYAVCFPNYFLSQLDSFFNRFFFFLHVFPFSLLSFYVLDSLSLPLFLFPLRKCRFYSPILLYFIPFSLRPTSWRYPWLFPSAMISASQWSSSQHSPFFLSFSVHFFFFLFRNCHFRFSFRPLCTFAFCCFLLR